MIFIVQALSSDCVVQYFCFDKVFIIKVFTGEFLLFVILADWHEWVIL